MANQHALAAEILESSAAGLASAAAAALRERIASAGGPSRPLGALKAHFTQRVLELAAAVRVDEPALFARRIAWLRRAYQARGLDETELAQTIDSLRAAVSAEMPAELVATIETPLAEAARELTRPLAPDVRNIDPGTDAGRLALRYLEACLDGRSDEAAKLILDSIDDEMTPQRVYLEVLVPALREIGQLWHVGDVSIAEEHLVSESTRRLITLIGHEHAPEIGNEHVVLAASVAGNIHDIGLRVISDLFRLDGWRTLFLGADVPPADIARAAQDFEADLVVLGATLEVQLKDVAKTIEEIRRSAPGAKVLVGGLVFSAAPDLWRQLGADGYAADAKDVVATGASLVG